MTDEKRKKYRTSSQVILIFTLLVFFILVATMLIVGFIMYAVFRRDTLNITTVENISLLTAFFLSSSIIIGTIISIVIGRVVLKDVDRIVDGMQDLSRGEYETRVPQVKGGLAKDLVEQFNALASELENTRSMRADFINDFAHEFKTPIVSLLGFAKLLKSGNLTKEQEKEYLAVIEEEAERLSVLSTNALNLTRVDKQTILDDESKFNLSEQIRNCILLLEKKWNAKNLDLQVEIDETFVFANEEMLKQVWINLIDNAIKFATENSALEIKLIKTSEHTVFRIKNKGSEISEQEREKIFGRFYRAKNSCGIEGNGVGLAIVKKIVDLHKGNIMVESSNGYTEFSVILPLEKD